MQFTKDNINICITEKQVKSSEELKVGKKAGNSHIFQGSGKYWYFLGNTGK